jgi:hypothetical protein
MRFLSAKVAQALAVPFEHDKPLTWCEQRAGAQEKSPEVVLVDDTAGRRSDTRKSGA